MIFKVEKTNKTYNQIQKNHNLILVQKIRKSLLSFLAMGIVNKCAKFGEAERQIVYERQKQDWSDHNLKALPYGIPDFGVCHSH